MRRAIAILWSSFLVAVAAEGLFFSIFDPHDLVFSGVPIELSRPAIYTLGFFSFWIGCALSSALTCYLLVANSDSSIKSQPSF